MRVCQQPLKRLQQKNLLTHKLEKRTVVGIFECLRPLPAVQGVRSAHLTFSRSLKKRKKYPQLCYFNKLEHALS